MSEQLIPIEQGNTDVMKKVMSSGSAFLPRLQFMSSSAKLCKGGKFPINHFAIIQSEDAVDCGETIDVIVLASRPKALDTNVPVAYHDPQLDDDGNFGGDFKDVVDRASKKDSGCMWGPEFLMYVPSTEQYVTFFMGSITARGDAPFLQAHLGQAITLEGREIVHTKKDRVTGQQVTYEYWSPRGIECETVVTPPDLEAVRTETTKFQNPPAPESDVASDDEAEATDRVQ